MQCFLLTLHCSLCLLHGSDIPFICEFYSYNQLFLLESHKEYPLHANLAPQFVNELHRHVSLADI